MALTETVAPVNEPLTTAEAKLHLRVDHSADDTLIDAYVRAARIRCQVEEARTYITTTYELTMDAFPSTRIIRLPRPPVQSVTSIQYVDTDGNTQTWSSALYRTDTSGNFPARIQPIETESWPTTDNRFAAVTITYVAGYGLLPADVPESVRSAIRLYIGHWYENRQDVEVGTISTQVQAAAHMLLADMVDGADYGD